MKHFGKIVHGTPAFYKPYQFETALKMLEGKEFELTIEPKKEGKTADQRAYFFATIEYLINNEEMFGGYTKSELTEVILEEVIGYTKIIEINGKAVERKFFKRVSELAIGEMTELIDGFLLFLGKQGIVPPPPEQFCDKYKTIKSK